MYLPCIYIYIFFDNVCVLIEGRHIILSTKKRISHSEITHFTEMSDVPVFRQHLNTWTLEGFRQREPPWTCFFRVFSPSGPSLLTRCWEIMVLNAATLLVFHSQKKHLFECVVFIGRPVQLRTPWAVRTRFFTRGQCLTLDGDNSPCISNSWYRADWQMALKFPIHEIK